ncbi:MAG: hypothetical protein AB7U79_06490 [Candidatus Izemoplasmatales bacterium]
MNNFDIESKLSMIDSLNQQAMMTGAANSLVEYVQNPANTAKLVLLVASVYGEVDALITNLDASTIDFIIYMTENQVEEPTQELILGAFSALLDVANVLNDALTQEEIDNVQTILTEVGTIFIEATVTDETLQAEYIQLLEDQVDYVFTTARLISTNLLTFMNELTLAEQVQIYTFINEASLGNLSETELTIEMCQLLDSIVFDSSLNVRLLLDNIVYAYWTGDTEFDLASVPLSTIQENAYNAYLEFVDVVGEVATFDASTLTEAQITTIQSLETAMNDIISAVSTNPNNLPV